MAVRVGVVGTSWWTGFMHLPTLSSHPQAQLTAVCGRNRDRAAEIAEKHHIPLVFTDYREMMRQGGLDAMIISAPDDLHHPMTMAALEAGLHVLCEKPLAMNASQAREMFEAARAKGVKHMVLFTYRWLPHIRYAYDLIQEGFVGRPYQAHFHFVGGYARSSTYAWRFDRTRANGILGD